MSFLFCCWIFLFWAGTFLYERSRRDSDWFLSCQLNGSDRNARVWHWQEPRSSYRKSLTWPSAALIRGTFFGGAACFSFFIPVFGLFFVFLFSSFVSRHFFCVCVGFQFFINDETSTLRTDRLVPKKEHLSIDGIKVLIRATALCRCQSTSSSTDLVSLSTSLYAPSSLPFWVNTLSPYFVCVHISKWH